MGLELWQSNGNEIIQDFEVDHETRKPLGEVVGGQEVLNQGAQHPVRVHFLHIQQKTASYHSKSLTVPDFRVSVAI